ncbi:MAG: hypothetical protein MSIBF_06035 [Candidatus Altiarchaeales archaeon IMC4]|nr:MAG: hypothetical protein MSIBF_06035 [Candidatus Altiarchaeales archaeon IMC4]
MEKYTGTKFRTILEADGAGSESGLIAAGKTLSKIGVVAKAVGNISVRIGGGMLITGAGSDLGDMSAEDIVYVGDYRAGVCRARGKKEPSSETPMHWSVYSEFPEVNAIVHVHDKAVMENGAVIKTTEREEPYGTPELAGQVVDALRPDNRYIIIKNHGCLAVGKTLSEAVKLAMDFHERFANDKKKFHRKFLCRI